MTLTDNNDETKKVKVVLKSNSSNVLFANISDVTGGSGYMNDYIKYPNKEYPNNSKLVDLDVNVGKTEKDKKAQSSLNMNKVVVYSPKKITKVKVGVFYMSEEVYNSINIDDLKLEDLSSWSEIPERKVISIYDDDSTGESLYTYSD